MSELLLFIVVFILLSGLMAAIEAAILSVSAGEVEELCQRNAWGSQALQAITRQITRPVIVMVIFTNTINILGPILTGWKAVQLYGDLAVGWMTGILTVGTIVFSEIIPKSLGTHYATRISRWFAPTLQWLTWGMYPIVWPFEWLLNQLKRGDRPIGTEAQIRSLTRIGRREGHIGIGEGKLIQRAFLLNDRSAADIMTPLSDAVMIAESTSIRDAATLVFQHAFSRYPVFGNSVDEIQGLVMSRDILEALAHGKDHEPVSSLSRPGLIVPGTTRSDVLLLRFRDQRVHLAVVQDQGRTLGLVTLEDVLEELVGEIEDEKD